jgi:hypothetical protein
MNESLYNYELEVGQEGLNVWFEDFICVVVSDMWSVTVIICVKIRCQETDRENFAEEYPLFRSVT